ncbi:MAG TPA: SLC13 family permease, partial [Thermoanaerobaculia bacterium]|nr:SLC13 family permease [Thermoanaerobaculia bacterium]
VTAANVGSVATVIGNPQNMLVGIASGIPFLRFTAALLPVALAGLAIIWVVLVVVYRRDFGAGPLPAHPPLRPLRPLLRKAAWASLLLVVAIAAGAPLPLAALLAASLLLVTRRLKPERVFREIDWSLLVFFAALFVVTAALGPLGVSGRLFAWAAPALGAGVAPLAGVAVLLSNVVSNVPAVLLLRPLVPHLAHPERAWLTVAMATTLAGNMTLLGSVANLIVAELARVRGVRLSFGEYLKAGLPVTLLSLAAGIAWLTWRG